MAKCKFNRISERSQRSGDRNTADSRSLSASRKFAKGDTVEVYRQGGECLGRGIILGGQYYKESKSYDYLVGSLDNKRRAWFNEENVKHVSADTQEQSYS